MEVEERVVPSIVLDASLRTIVWLPEYSSKGFIELNRTIKMMSIIFIIKKNLF